MQRQLSTPELSIFQREQEEEEDLEAKPEKAPAIRSSSERYIHLIPVLTVLCYVVLVPCSHAPSASGYVELWREGCGEREAQVALTTDEDPATQDTIIRIVEEVM